ncbi:MAG: hypothetical protein AAFX99_31650, partial [Myxococcota bacterium]
MDRESLERWKPVVRAFDPRRPLQREEIDTLYVRRDRAPSHEVLRRLSFDQDEAPLFVMCGSRGSGKSTELARLEKAFDDQRIIARVDLMGALPRPYSSVGLLMALGLVALRMCQDWEADTTRAYTKASKTLEEAFEAIMATQDNSSGKSLNIAKLVASIGGLVAVSSPEPVTKVLAGASAAVAGATQFVWTAGSGQAALTASDEASVALLQAVNEAFELARQCTTSANSPEAAWPALLLADGLDKLVALQDIIDVLNNPKLLSGLNVPLVLTAPINLMHNTEFNAVRQFASPLPLYNLPVVDKDHDEHEGTGAELLKEVCQKRSGAYQLPDAWLADEALRSAIRSSGGSMRDFMELISKAAIEAAGDNATQLAPQHMQEAVKDFRHQLE